MNIYVGNIPYNTTESDISRLFEEFGDVQSVKLIKDFETGKLKGFGFVEMEQSAAQKAIESLHEFEINDRKIVVNEARQKTERRSNNNNRDNYNSGNNRRRY